MALTALLCVLLAVNLGTYLAFAADKRRAVQGARRLPEARLLILALCGGWPAAKLAQRRLRHKTRKQPFARRLDRIPMLWGLAAALTFGTAPWTGFLSPPSL